METRLRVPSSSTSSSSSLSSSSSSSLSSSSSSSSLSSSPSPSSLSSSWSLPEYDEKRSISRMVVAGSLGRRRRFSQFGPILIGRRRYTEKGPGEESHSGTAGDLAVIVQDEVLHKVDSPHEKTRNKKEEE
ncbi:hypothetical protein K0M31_017997 [Melipona bicolor]|uniref:Uncharacterized protein n=1 Tax=Melipona bicolor TaxID=60889 RepID=A0AA40FD64_9HYME|nr:hypothetical protein K0M31_017997 [Melipona bicolor]